MGVWMCSMWKRSLRATNDNAVNNDHHRDNAALVRATSNKTGMFLLPCVPNFSWWTFFGKYVHTTGTHHRSRQHYRSSRRLAIAIVYCWRVCSANAKYTSVCTQTHRCARALTLCSPHSGSGIQLHLSRIALHLCRQYRSASHPIQTDAKHSTLGHSKTIRNGFMISVFVSLVNILKPLAAYDCKDVYEYSAEIIVKIVLKFSIFR